MGNEAWQAPEPRERPNSLERYPELRDSLYAWCSTSYDEIRASPLSFDEVVDVLAGDPRLLTPVREYLTSGSAADRYYEMAAHYREELAWAVLKRLTGTA